MENQSSIYNQIYSGMRRFSGFLKKLKSKTRWFGNTNIRWFELNFETMKFGYKNDESDKEFAVEYDFNLIKDFKSDWTFKEKQFCKWCFCFKVVLVDREHILYCESDKDYQMWSYAFKKMFEMRNWDKKEKKEGEVKDERNNMTKGTEMLSCSKKQNRKLGNTQEEEGGERCKNKKEYNNQPGNKEIIQANASKNKDNWIENMNIKMENGGKSIKKEKTAVIENKPSNSDNYDNNKQLNTKHKPSNSYINWNITNSRADTQKSLSNKFHKNNISSIDLIKYNISQNELSVNEDDLFDFNYYNKDNQVIPIKQLNLNGKALLNSLCKHAELPQSNNAISNKPQIENLKRWIPPSGNTKTTWLNHTNSSTLITTNTEFQSKIFDEAICDNTKLSRNDLQKTELVGTVTKDQLKEMMIIINAKSLESNFPLSRISNYSKENRNRNITYNKCNVNKIDLN